MAGSLLCIASSRRPTSDDRVPEQMLAGLRALGPVGELVQPETIEDGAMGDFIERLEEQPLQLMWSIRADLGHAQEIMPKLTVQEKRSL